MTAAILRRTGRPIVNLCDEREGRALSVVQDMLAYLREQPGASDKEVRAHLAQLHGRGSHVTKYDIFRARRETGAVAEDLREDAEAARGALVEFFREDASAPQAAAFRHLRGLGLAPPRFQVIRDARRTARHAATHVVPMEYEDAVEIMADRAYEYLAMEPGAGNAEIRSYVFAVTRIRAVLSGVQLQEIRRDVGVVPTPTRHDPYEAFAMLTGFFSRNPGAKSYEARAFLRHEGLANPGRDMVVRARSKGQFMHEQYQREMSAKHAAEAEPQCE